LLSLDSGEQIRLTNDGEKESHLRWSPDGGRIAFAQWPIQINPQPGIYAIPAEPNAQKTLMVTGHSMQFSWIPSGAKWIDADGSVITPSGDGFLLWTEAVYVNGERIQLYQSGVYDISPDGKWLAVPSGWGEVEGRWIAITKACPVLGLSPCKPLLEGYRGSIRWSPDGEWIGFIDEFREEGHIFAKNITTNVLLELTEEKIYNEEGKISWFPDSRRIAFSTRLRGSQDLWILAF
jgi:Tol biopolymer transport system component